MAGTMPHDTTPSAIVETVVKLGGSTLAHPELFEGAARAIDTAAASHRLLVVPGGGPFAEAVRRVDRRLGLPDDTAHWMAVTAMDQFAELLASRLARGEVVTVPRDIGAVLGGGGVPVLAPGRWLRRTDPLPHSWDVTGDSIAAWVAGRVGASRLVLIKAPGLKSSGLDAYFTRAIPREVEWAVVPVDDARRMAAALGGAPDR